jgi:3D (Asp-Asp-Asp) domain-containing protein
MTKSRPLLCGLIIITLLLAAYAVIFYARSGDAETMPKSIPAGKTLTMQATAFCEYGWDKDGLDYGPGYCIVSSKGEIPPYSLLEINQYGEAQAVAVSDELTPDEIQLWYNAPSDVPMFGQQEVKVKIKGKGDIPCANL